MKIKIRIEEVENRDLAVFLFTSSLSSESEADFEEQPATFYVTHNDIDFEVNLGVMRSRGKLDAYTEIIFEYSLDCDLAVFDDSPKPVIVSGRKRSGGSIAQVKYFGDTDESYLYSYEGLEIEIAQEQESSRIDREVRKLLPLMSEIIGRVREAVRLELFSEAISWDFLIESIKTVQRHKNVSIAEMDPFIDDATYLFAAFRPKGAARLPQDSNTYYVLEDSEGRAFKGEVLNTRTGKSPITFANSLDAIQERINRRGPIQERALLAACEFLYADDFRMAVFNAVTVLELYLIDSYKSCTKSGTREGFLMERKIQEYKKESGESPSVALLKKYAPHVLSKDRDWQPLIEVCLDAWNFRDKSVAHLTTGEEERELSRREAWEMVVSIWSVVNDLDSAR